MDSFTLVTDHKNYKLITNAHYMYYVGVFLILLVICCIRYKKRQIYKKRPRFNSMV
jgi:hypothetical protein